MSILQPHSRLIRVLGFYALILIPLWAVWNRECRAQDSKPTDSAKRDGDQAARGRSDELKSKQFYQGRVIDKTTGKPIVGALIEAKWLVNGIKFDDCPVTKAETGGDGSFRIAFPFEDWSQLSDYYITVKSSGYVPVLLLGQGFIEQEILNYSNKQLERSLKHEIEEPNIRLIKTTEPKDSIGLVLKSIALRPGKVISGRLVDRGGKPLVGFGITSHSLPMDRVKDDSSVDHAYSDQEGRFRIVTPAGDRVILLMKNLDKKNPNQDDDISTYFQVLAADDKGDLGDLHPEEKVAIRGRLLDQNGNPIVRHPVGAKIEGGIGSIQYDTAFAIIENECDVVRNTTTDDHGEFTLAPLPPGTYVVEPKKQQSYQKKFRVRFPPPDPAAPPVVEHKNVAFDELLYLPIVMKLDPARPPDSITFKPIPHIVVEAQLIRSSKAKLIPYPSRLSIKGKLGDEVLESDAYPKDDGSLRMSVARDLTDVTIVFLSDPRSAVRHRFNGEKTWNNNRLIYMEKLVHNIKALEIDETAAATIRVKISTTDRSQLKNSNVSATYPRGRSPMETIQKKFDPAALDVEFQKSDEGEYVSHEIVPDEDLTITVQAEGYESASQTVNLKEGEDRAMEFFLKKKVIR